MPGVAEWSLYRVLAVCIIAISWPPERVVVSRLSRNGSAGALRLFGLMGHTPQRVRFNYRSAESAGTQNLPYRTPKRIQLHGAHRVLAKDNTPEMLL